MTDIPADIDPFIAERITEIRDRFGTAGLRAAIGLATSEIAIFEDQAQNLPDGPAPA
jgi:hypothetical protein